MTEQGTGKHPAVGVEPAAGPAVPVMLDGDAVRIADLRMGYPTANGRDALVALEKTSLAIHPGEFVAVVGPSGCGKSTLLSAISGLRRPLEGDVWVNGDQVRGIRHDVGFVFQQDALLPWRKAVDNVALGLRLRGASRKDAGAEARRWLKRVGLAGFEDVYPHQLSGGMRKRVAVAATLVYGPSVLLMDEPFSALDIQTRNIMENDLLDIWSAYGHQSVVFVTHDLEEAIGLSDRVVVLTTGPGRIAAEFDIDLPRPRNLIDLKATRGFEALYAEIWSVLRDEVLKASNLS